MAMNDPHVEFLEYRIKHGEHVDYSKAPPFEHNESDFHIRIAEGRAKITMIAHYPTREDARAAVEPMLRTWELDTALRYGPQALEFKYEGGELIDRRPTPGAYTMEAEPGRISVKGVDVKMTIGVAEFPAPPTNMARDPIVDMMFDRHILYRQGGTTLADAAYFCLTALEVSAGSRRAASSTYVVDKKVLDRIGELSANKGGATARKALAAQSDFTPSERQWLEEAIILTIRRAAEVAAGSQAQLRRLTMTDLRKL